METDELVANQIAKTIKMLHTTKVKQQLVVSPGPTSDTWPTFDQNQFTSTYNLNQNSQHNSQHNFQHNFNNSSWANNNSSSSSPSSSTFNTSNLTSNSTNNHHPHSSNHPNSSTNPHSSIYPSFSTNHSNASYLEKQILLKQTRELLLEKQQKLNNSICSSVGHEESSSTSLSSTCFTISGEENGESGENFKNEEVNDCMEDDDDAFSPVLSPGRKRNYTPNVDGFSKKDTAQVTARTSLLEIPTKNPIPPPNSPSLTINRHSFQNSTISATSSASSLCSSAEGYFPNNNTTIDFSLNKRARFE